MSRRRVGQVASIFYIFFYVFAMVLPRKLSNGHSSTHVFSFKRIFHEILYYGGPLEPVANFFFLMPVFAILLRYLGKSRAIPAVYICVALSASAELLQKLIPGRVSSLRDFFLNSAGVVTAYLTVKVLSKINVIKPKI